MKFSASTISFIFVTFSSVYAAPVQVEERAPLSFGGAGAAVGTTILGATFGAGISVLLSCLQSGSGASCIGLKKRDFSINSGPHDVVEETKLILQAMQYLDASSNSTNAEIAKRATTSSAGKAIGTTLLGSGFGAGISVLLSCLEQGSGIGCIGLKKRDVEIEERSPAGFLGVGTAIGTTLLGSGFGAGVSVLLNCLEQGSGAACIGLKKRELDNVQQTEILAAFTNYINNTATAQPLEERSTTSLAGQAAGTVGTSILGGLITSSVGGFLKCLQGGVSAGSCFSTVLKRDSLVATTAEEMSPDVVNYIKALAAAMDAQATATDGKAPAIAARGVSTTVATTIGTAGAGALFGNIFKCITSGLAGVCLTNLGL